MEQKQKKPRNLQQVPGFAIRVHLPFLSPRVRGRDPESFPNFDRRDLTNSRSMGGLGDRLEDRDDFPQTIGEHGAITIDPPIGDSIADDIEI